MHLLVILTLNAQNKMKLLYKLSLLTLIFTFLSPSFSFSQIRIAIYKTDVSQLKKSLVDELNDNNSYRLKSIADEIVRFYSNDKRFTVIDRANFNLIENEQELQKSEEFIDGYVVQQGKQEGADYILYSSYDKKEKAIRLRVYDVASKSVKCEASEGVNTTLGFINNARKNIIKLLYKVNSDCFELTFPVVRSLDKKQGKKVKTLLIAAGRNHNTKEGSVFEIFKTVEEKVGDEIYQRREMIGTGKITEVEDNNFSILKVTNGGAEIASALNDSEELYCDLRQ